MIICISDLILKTVTNRWYLYQVIVMIAVTGIMSLGIHKSYDN